LRGRPAPWRGAGVRTGAGAGPRCRPALPTARSRRGRRALGPPRPVGPPKPPDRRGRMERILMSLLRGICQMPAYVAKEKGFFFDEGLDVEIEIQPTAWMVPERLRSGAVQFAVIPWTRVAAASARGDELMLICGSGYEEAAVVVRSGLARDRGGSV